MTGTTCPEYFLAAERVSKRKHSPTINEVFPLHEAACSHRPLRSPHLAPPRLWCRVTSSSPRSSRSLPPACHICSVLGDSGPAIKKPPPFVVADGVEDAGADLPRMYPLTA
eukprot:CAMPEP_0181114830 /NCGR_PEP_ID=MMETSP1071-20121207/21112_1 /TAXON_ID=35127 /ORGANISM="Thalassiosira sp., Strain NH16" /LENGTH=110 /DNA_ID=CAMNT_0023199005 /DNA_START=533 /DNA_END=865 /DNA_ORIENTATION=+